MSPPPKLLDQGREALRIKHYALRTEQAYVSWIKRFVFKEPVGIDPRLHTCCLGHAPVDFGACNPGTSRSKRDLVVSNLSHRARGADYLFLRSRVAG